MIAVNRKAPKALHRQIYEAYRAAVVGGSETQISEASTRVDGIRCPGRKRPPSFPWTVMAMSKSGQVAIVSDHP